MLHIEDRGQTGGKFDPFNTVLDMLDPDDLDHTDFTGVPAVGTGAGFDITGDFHYPDILPGGTPPW